MLRSMMYEAACGSFLLLRTSFAAAPISSRLPSSRSPTASATDRRSPASTESRISAVGRVIPEILSPEKRPAPHPAGLRVARLEPSLERRHTVGRGSMRPGFRLDVAGRHPLERIVAHRGGSPHSGLRVARLEQAFPGATVTPDSRKAVGLQRDRDLSRPPLPALGHQPELVLN